jgi:uncharacterized protein (TIGR03435 family)
VRHSRAAAAILTAICATSLGAQDRLAFDVSSVRANTSGDRRTSLRFTPAGDLTAVNQPVRVLVTIAYELPIFRIEGMPDWFERERFDVSAKAPAGLTLPLAEIRGPLLRSLLEDRFTLRARRVTKEVAAMVLTLAGSDGDVGARLRRSTVDCVAAIAALRGRGPVVPPGEPTCGLGGSSAGRMCGRAVTLDQLTFGLSGVYQRPVVDHTGLEGRFDFDLSFTPDNPGGPGVAFGAACPAATGDRPALSTALQEQLGLRIRSERAPVEVLVIESAERPDDN